MRGNEKFQSFSFLFILFASLFTAAVVNAQTDKTANFDDDAILKLMNEHKIPAVGVGFIQDGKLKRVKVFGEIKKGEAAPPNTIFNVASLTKPVVAMLALKLVNAGKWNLDEPLDKYWVDPDVKNDARHKKLTTRHVLTHQTGFANWRWLNESKKLEFAFEPGTNYQYSGEGFEYLRRALESKFKKPLEKLAEELIFKPAGMQDAQFFWDANTDESRFAVGYDKQGKAYKIYKNERANAADDLLTSVEDYGKFMLSVMNGDGFSKELYNEMLSRQVKRKENKYFGLGWEVYDLGGGELALSHGGSDEGTKTIVFLLPKSKQGLIIFANSDNGIEVYLKLINDYLKDFGRQIIDIEFNQK